MQFGVNEENEVSICAYKIANDPLGFSKDDLVETYLQASPEILKGDEVAESSLAGYFQGISEIQKVNLVEIPDQKLEPVLLFDIRNSRESVRMKDPFEDYCSPYAVFPSKKYKPVALKVRPVLGELDDKFRIKRNITGDPLEGIPKLNPNPPEFVPTGRYTQERKEIVDRLNGGDFLWKEERKLMHHLMMEQNLAFAWNDAERGQFRDEFFSPVDIATVPHVPWVKKNIPIPPGLYPLVCEAIKKKIDAKVYEPSNSSYRSQWFGVLKKDGKSLRLVHSLEPLNAVTIAHSGLPPATETLAEHFAGRSCGACLDLYSGYDGRTIAESSRDYTTFQSPFGALRLVRLPQGWTNSVLIFHDDVTHILREEIPHVTIPYIDDVPVRGPKTRYELPGGGYETIPENKGIRRFVWEHFQNLNRVIQRMKYCGGTFSGLKAVLCADEFAVVGHQCSYEGRKPSTDRIGVITRWGPCPDLSDVRSFLGTTGVFRVFVEDYARKAEPLIRLTRLEEDFTWGDAQAKAQQELKDALENCPALKPLDYSWDSDIILAVDTSWKAIGIIIYQCDPKEPKKRYYSRFMSITMNDREARFSQAKRELYGLKRALDATKYWLLGCRKLVVETDAKYIHGMLSNPSMGPNATINRWIEEILLYQFKLRHTAGAKFAPDGLSRRDPQLGDEEYPRKPEDEEDDLHPYEFEQYDGVEPPLKFEDFKEEIDTRGGYFYEEPISSIDEFQLDCEDARLAELEF